MESKGLELIAKDTGLKIVDIVVKDNLRVEYIRYKLGHEREIGKGWDEIIAHETVRIVASNDDEILTNANARARQLAREHQCEVRWNYVWSAQGHYIQP